MLLAFGGMLATSLLCESTRVTAFPDKNQIIAANGQKTHPCVLAQSLPPLRNQPHHRQRPARCPQPPPWQRRHSPPPLAARNQKHTGWIHKSRTPYSQISTLQHTLARSGKSSATSFLK